MTQHLDRCVSPSEARGPPGWSAILKDYRRPSDARATFEVALTVLALAGCWAVIWALVSMGNPIAAPVALPAAGFLVRLFMIQHDCSHGSFFRRRAVNEWVGRAIGVLTLTPFALWQRTHALHHAGSGNLDRRGFGDIRTLTVEEYRSASSWERLRYRLYRNPLVLFGLGPIYLFLLQQRLPVGWMTRDWRPWVSAMGTNLSIAIVIGGLIWLVGLGAFLMVHLPIVALAGTAGVWLFYVQHQFERTRWRRTADWVHEDAALHGSSFYDLPRPLRWLTANIGIHHVHHVCSRIPSYRLDKVLRDHPALGAVGRLTLRDSLRCVRLVLWDETSQRLVSFADARTAIGLSRPAGAAGT